jgi:NAD(P)-dependent dehydrogenase (short-subunit alcohol dehydrogenase family)
MTNAERRNALVVGASRGLGFALVHELLVRGWVVTATRRSVEKGKLSSLADEWPGKLMIEQLDVIDDSEIDALKARLTAGRVDLLFINAGIIHKKDDTAETITRDEFARLMQINALGPARLAERLLDLLVPNGTVAAMTSELASITNNEDAVWDCYRASKAALNMLMRCVALRHCNEQRSFLLIAPGWVKTDLGGSDATLEISASIPRVVDQIEAVCDMTGLHFLNYEGKTLPW